MEHYWTVLSSLQKLCKYVPELRQYPGLKIGTPGGPDGVTNFYQDLAKLCVSSPCIILVLHGIESFIRRRVKPRQALASLILVICWVIPAIPQRREPLRCPHSSPCLISSMLIPHCTYVLPTS